MRESVKKYISLFEKTLNLSGLSWWLIDFEDEADFYYCNALMKKTFSLDLNADWHSVARTCPIIGDYQKNIKLASKTNEHTQIILSEYKALLDQQVSEYSNSFPYFCENLNKNLYFSSRAKILEVNEKGRVSIVYGIIEDITVQEEYKKEIESLVGIDKLTGIGNRYKLDAALVDGFKRAQRYNTSFSVIIVDIDYFKLVNDTYGHNVGDIVLTQFASILSDNARNVDIVGRWGGEEFLVLLPSTELNDAESLAEKLRKIIECFNFETGNVQTASFGVSQFTEGDDIRSMLSRVDKALYKAKESGRNKVEKL